jgi:hypothetical protein
MDFNYGATSIDCDKPSGERASTGFGNVELAAKYRFLHQSDAGWDVAVFPRLFLPSASERVGAIFLVCVDAFDFLI